jgi:hypothetical protein
MAHTPSALATEDLVVPQGATESATWPAPWVYAEGDAPGPPGGWPGDWSARMEVRDEIGGALLAHLTDTGAQDGILILDTEVQDGITYARITAQIPAVVSAAWSWADEPAVYDVELVSTGGRVIRLVEGPLTLSGEVTSDE